MLSTDAQPAASSAAPIAPPSFAAYEAEQNARDRGVEPEKIAPAIEPEPTIAAQPAESAPAQPEEQAASTEVKPEGASETPKPPKNAETRVQELLRERSNDRTRIARLEAQIAELSQSRQVPDVKAAPSPAPAGDTFPDYERYVAQHPDASYEAYTDARVAFSVERALKADREQRQREEASQRASRTAQERETKYQQRLKDAGITGDDLPEHLDLLVPAHYLPRDEQGRFTKRPSGYNALGDLVLDSDAAPQFVRHFADHPEDMHRIAGLLPRDLMLEFARLETRLSQPASPAAPPPKTVTSAPPPPDSLGRRPAAASDPIEAAVGRKDFRAYEAESNRRDLAARGRR